MTDRRNFRSSYLEKVGIKGVEEKKSIEILLKEPAIDMSKLSQFCTRFAVPPMYRVYVWKIMLGIVPSHQGGHPTVMRERTRQYEDVREALLVMRRITEETPLPEAFLKTYLIEERVLLYDESKLLEDPRNQYLVSIASGMCAICPDPVDAYWLTKKFYQLTESFEQSIPLMLKRVEYYLEKEDVDRKLFDHVVSLGGYQALPITMWFRTAYSGLLDESCLERIWDKMVGGSCKILVYVAVAILLTLKRPLLTMQTKEAILTYLSEISDDNMQNITSKAIELWHKHGSLLKPSSGSSASKGASPSGGIPHHRSHVGTSPSGVCHHHHKGNSPGYHHPGTTPTSSAQSSTSNRPPS